MGQPADRDRILIEAGAGLKGNRRLQKTNWTRVAAALLAGLGVVGAACGPEFGGGTRESDPTLVPELRVEGPADLLAAAEGVRRIERSRLAAAMHLTGLEEPGVPIHVVLVPEDSDTAERTPAWVAGYADGAADLVVLFPQRSLSYPDASVGELVGHEVAHVLIHRAAAGRPVPRWFHEGLAMVAGGSWGPGDSSRVTLALLAGRVGSLADVEQAFAAGDPARIPGAYALAGAFVRDLLSREGSTAGARILAGVARGLDFEAAFARATGSSLARAEASFWDRSDRWYRWVPVLTSSVTLWVGVMLLALWAYRRRRARAEGIRERWQEDGVSPDA